MVSYIGLLIFAVVVITASFSGKVAGNVMQLDHSARISGKDETEFDALMRSSVGGKTVEESDSQPSKEDFTVEKIGYRTGDEEKDEINSSESLEERDLPPKTLVQRISNISPGILSHRSSIGGVRNNDMESTLKFTLPFSPEDVDSMIEVFHGEVRLKCFPEFDHTGKNFRGRKKPVPKQSSEEEQDVSKEIVTSKPALGTQNCSCVCPNDAKGNNLKAAKPLHPNKNVKNEKLSDTPYYKFYSNFHQLQSLIDT